MKRPECPPPPDSPMLRRLAELGWIEERNIVFDCVSTFGRLDQLPALDASRDAGVAGPPPGTCHRATRWIGPLRSRLGQSQRGLRWVFHRHRSSARTGRGTGTRRSLLPLPMT